MYVSGRNVVTRPQEFTDSHDIWSEGAWTEAKLNVCKVSFISFCFQIVAVYFKNSDSGTTVGYSLFSFVQATRL